MSVVASSEQERREFDAFVDVIRRIKIGHAPFAGLAGAAGVSEADLRAGLLRFLSSCRLAVVNSADAEATLQAALRLIPPDRV